MIDVNIVRGTGTDMRTYPRLMEDKEYIGFVVLFLSPSVGCVLTDTSEDGGKYFTDWDMNRFEDFTGTLELRNT